LAPKTRKCSADHMGRLEKPRYKAPGESDPLRSRQVLSSAPARSRRHQSNLDEKERLSRAPSTFIYMAGAEEGAGGVESCHPDWLLMGFR
jgi:hypothetical protein